MKGGTGGDGELDEGRRPLVRIASCAVFHKLTPGAGVPHSFVAFLRQRPALPRVVVRSFCLRCWNVMVSARGVDLLVGANDPDGACWTSG